MEKWGSNSTGMREKYWKFVRDKASSQFMYAKPVWFKQIVADMKRHEGFYEYAYPDPLSPLARKYSIRKYWGTRPGSEVLAELGEQEALGRPWTVGYGFTNGVTPSTRMPRQQSDRMLEQLVMEVAVEMERLVPDWKRHPVVVQTVLINLLYNLGFDKLKQFTTTLALIKANKYKEAGENLKKSLWFKQVGVRGVELTNRLINMRIEPEHQV